MIDLDDKGKQKELAELLGVSVTTIVNYERQSVWGRDDTLREQLQKYIYHLRERAAGRAADGGLDLATERAALAAMQKQKVELEVAKMRGELVDARELYGYLFTMARQIRNSFQTLPDRIAVQAAAEIDPRKVFEMLEAEVEQILSDMVTQFEETNINQKQQEKNE